MNDGTKNDANNMPCKIVRIETIQVKLHDELGRKLTDVQHVRDLKEKPHLYGYY